MLKKKLFFILIDVLRPRVIHGLCNCFNLRLVTDLTGVCLFIIRLSFLKNEEKLLFTSLSLLLIRVFQFIDEIFKRVSRKTCKVAHLLYTFDMFTFGRFYYAELREMISYNP